MRQLQLHAIGDSSCTKHQIAVLSIAVLAMNSIDVLGPAAIVVLTNTSSDAGLGCLAIAVPLGLEPQLRLGFDHMDESLLPSPSEISLL